MEKGNNLRKKIVGIALITAISGAGLTFAINKINNYYLSKINIPADTESQIFRNFLERLDEENKNKIPKNYQIPPVYIKPDYYFYDDFKSTNI